MPGGYCRRLASGGYCGPAGGSRPSHFVECNLVRQTQTPDWDGLQQSVCLSSNVCHLLPCRVFQFKTAALAQSHGHVVSLSSA